MSSSRTSQIQSESKSSGYESASFESEPHVYSSESDHPSLSSSVSALSPIPSPSLSVVSFASSGNVSFALSTPSPSMSSSSGSHTPSLSTSEGVLELSFGSEPHEYSTWS